MKKHEILDIILTMDASSIKGYFGAALVTFMGPARAIGVVLGLVLVVMSIIEKYYAIKKNRKP